jgi:glyoxylase-like metal-dependent hydrolase (beta-lactamase superfamily II)
MKIGPYTIQLVETGLFALDGGAMFGVVPKNLWSRTNPADEQNRIDMSMNALLLRGGGRNILIDNGVGHKYDSKFASIYRIDHARYTIDDSLRALGVSPNDITDVILTHLHFDHAGGSTCRHTDGTVLPAFPNARYYIQKKQFEWAARATEKDRASFLKDDYMPLVEHGQLELLDGPGSPAANVELLVVNGHTMGQQLPIISDGQSTLFFCGDLVPLSAHVPIPYVMAYDLQPMVTIEEKRAVLARAVEEEWTLFFEHDPRTRFGRVTQQAKGYRLEPVAD